MASFSVMINFLRLTVTCDKAFFITLLLWLMQINVYAQHNNKEEYIQIFNGKDLDGWKGDSVYWRVENGILTGEVTPATILKKNSFIIWQGTMPENFELKVSYRVSAKGNSGVNYRSSLVEGEPFALKGYQADIDGEDNWSGQNYEERGREFLALRGQKTVIEPGKKITMLNSIGSKDSLQQFIKKEDWNGYHLIVKGNRMQHFINGVLMSDATDEDSLHRNFKGYLGVQVHVGPPMKIEYRDIRIKAIYNK
jgi:hypothetical protein